MSGAIFKLSVCFPLYTGVFKHTRRAKRVEEIPHKHCADTWVHPVLTIKPWCLLSSFSGRHVKKKQPFLQAHPPHYWRTIYSLTPLWQRATTTPGPQALTVTPVSSGLGLWYDWKKKGLFKWWCAPHTKTTVPSPPTPLDRTLLPFCTLGEWKEFDELAFPTIPSFRARGSMRMAEHKAGPVCPANKSSQGIQNGHQTTLLRLVWIYHFHCLNSTQICIKGNYVNMHMK